MVKQAKQALVATALLVAYLKGHHVRRVHVPEMSVRESLGVVSSALEEARRVLDDKRRTRGEAAVQGRPIAGQDATPSAPKCHEPKEEDAREKTSLEVEERKATIQATEVAQVLL